MDPMMIIAPLIATPFIFLMLAAIDWYIWRIAEQTRKEFEELYKDE